MAEESSTTPVDMNFIDSIHHSYRLLFSGGVAGCVAKTATAPLSRLTILYQINTIDIGRNDNTQLIKGPTSDVNNIGVNNKKTKASGVSSTSPLTESTSTVHSNSNEKLNSSTIMKESKTTKIKPPLKPPGASSAAYADNIFLALRKVVQEEGFLAFWKGNGTSVLHRFPYAAINFYAYENFKSHFSNRQKASETPFVRLISGAFAGGVACSMCYPLDLIRTRFTMASGHDFYSSIPNAFYKISQKEGVLGLYRGLGPTLFVSVPNLAISYCIYGTMKEWIWKVRHPGENVHLANVEEPNFVDSLIAGATSGICSSLVTYPIDVVRRRLQVLGLHKSAKEIGALQEFQNILRIDGTKGLYRGLTPELLKVTPTVGFTFCTYEFMKDLLGV